MASTVESLVTSLQTYLTSQIPLIPALHAQLGLPPSALSDELSELHSALIDCVDKKIEERRKEIDEWMSKCEAIESVCIGFAKALGSHAKTLASTVGELRKQQALPKRFDYLNVYHEKLQLLYQTKYEQGVGLVTKIGTFVHVLGNDFFPPDNLSMIPAQGTEEEDPLALKDVTPERLSKLEKEIVRAKSEITKRRIHLSQTFLEIGALHEELGLPFPAETELVALPKSVSGSSTPSSASDPFISSIRSSFGPSSISRRLSEDELRSYSGVFARFISRLEEAVDESLDLDGPGNEMFGVENVDPTVGLIKWAEGLKEDLIELQERREAHIQMLYVQLERLWARLDYTLEDMQAFADANRGSTEANVRAYEIEYERMLELKQAKMASVIANARAEIRQLWDELILSEEERGSFAPLADDELTDEVLALHEEEVEKLKEERRIKAPVLAALKQYFQICDEEKQLAAAASDQSRLLGRGPRDPGRLLREEKLRKRVAREKPRLEKELLTAITAWETVYERPFLVNGESILETLVGTIAEEEEKENRKRNRPGSVPPRGTTPQPTRSVSGEHTTPATTGHGPSASKRPRLGNYNQNTNGHDPHSQSHSSPIKPSGSYGAKAGKNALSSLPRPMSNPRQRPGQRVVSSSSVTAGTGMPRVPSNASTGRTVSNSTSLFNKRAGGRARESFRPRPSADTSLHESTLSSSSSMLSHAMGNVRPWTQMMGRVQEEVGY